VPSSFLPYLYLCHLLTYSVLVHLQSWVAAAVNISIDVLCLLLPLPQLAGLRIETKKKLQIFAMFSLGFLLVPDHIYLFFSIFFFIQTRPLTQILGDSITIISVIRLTSLVRFANTTNVTYDYVAPGLYSLVEATAGIVCSCLPSIRVLLTALMPRIFPRTQDASEFTYTNDPSTDLTGFKFSRLESPNGTIKQLANQSCGHANAQVGRPSQHAAESISSFELGSMDQGVKAEPYAFYEDVDGSPRDGMPGQAL
jgi:hypothetical protein